MLLLSSSISLGMFLQIDINGVAIDIDVYISNSRQVTNVIALL